MTRIVGILLIMAMAFFVFLAVLPPSAETSPVPIRDLLLCHGVEATGALNLVTAVYLGCRLYDTLGESIVLLLAVAGVTLLLGERE